jgi:hypothetical protein
MAKRQKGQTMIYKTLHRRTNTTMAKRKKGLLFLSCIVLCRSLFVPFFFWPLLCLSFCVVLCRSLFVPFIFWPLRRAATTMAKRQKGQTMIYKTLHRRTNTTMAKRKKGQTMIFKTLYRRTDNTMARPLLCLSYCVVLCRSLFVPFIFWPLLCLSYCVVLCRSLFVPFIFWPLLCLSFCVVFYKIDKQ